MSFAHRLLDVLREITRIYEVFQSDTTTITSLHTSVQKTVLTVKLLATQPGGCLKSFVNRLQPVEDSDVSEQEGEKPSQIKYRHHSTELEEKFSCYHKMLYCRLYSGSLVS